MRKIVMGLAAFVFITAAGSQAHADSVKLTAYVLSAPSAAGETITLNGLGGTGVTATVSNYSLVGNTFTFTITNTSVAPGATGTITNIGFALPGDRPENYTLVSSTNPNYSIAYNLNATAGSQNVVSDFDFALVDKTNGNPTFGGGNVNNGIAGGTSATFVITGDFSGLTAEQIANSIFARFQGVNGGDSDVANVGNVPEPMTMLLFGTGLAGIAARARRKRRA